MKFIYASPLRVYLCLALLALAGLWSGLQLPVSLFPNSSKPEIVVTGSYGTATATEFVEAYGRSLESRLRGISDDRMRVEKLQANYWSSGFRYKISFEWGAQPQAALREVQNAVNAAGGSFPKDVRDSLGVWGGNGDGGFIAVSFYSTTRSLDELYRELEPVLGPRVAKVRDANEAELWNPTQKEIRLELNPVTMASLGLFPRDVQDAVLNSMYGRSGGQVTIGTQQLTIQMPRAVGGLEDLGRVPVQTPGGRTVHLSDIARVDIGPKTTSSRSFKTSGSPSLLLWAEPKPGGNVKRMAEEILDIVHGLEPTFAKDVRFKVLVDPSEFIRNSISNVFHEVLIGAGLAVLVLFLFLGSLRNTVTAAIEIPLSMVLAFILMKLSGMNLNLISLGGLALSAGMNVDASVVVMENIVRHFETLSERERRSLDFGTKLSMITQAVSEVRFSVIASTIASLVVFVPLAFTSDLTHAILGDLAKTVVFSHGFSAIVALILVPTVRLHLMSRASRQPHTAVAAPGHSPVAPQAHSPVAPKPHSPIEHHIVRLENAYAIALGRFINQPRLQRGTCAGVIVLLILLFALVLPRLPREVIGRPDTDWLVIGASTQGNTLVRQMESQVEEIEARILHEFGDKVSYTFTRVSGPNWANIMARLKDKRDMRAIWKAAEEKFVDTPFMTYSVQPWNPSELPIPDPPHMRLVVTGGDATTRAGVSDELHTLLLEAYAFPKLSTEPSTGLDKSIILRPNLEQWIGLTSQGARFFPSDLADLTRVATTGKLIGDMVVPESGGVSTDIVLTYPPGTVNDLEDIGALPIGVGGKLIPLKALSQIRAEYVPPTIYRENGRDLTIITGREKTGNESKAAADLKKARDLVATWEKQRPASTNRPTVFFEDAQAELTDALSQLGMAVGLSLLLMLVTLVMQFGGFAEALLVLVAVPLGLIGVLTALFVFQSTLSLNSVLGVILLNGIAVANSILLVDFQKRLVASGLEPRAAAIEAGRKRLRPILITSLTTILGMLPVALGLGEGGRILQPLGIAVSGGLWVSMGLTLFVVPALMTAWLERTGRERVASGTRLDAVAVSLATSLAIFDAEAEAYGDDIGHLLARDLGGIPVRSGSASHGREIAPSEGQPLS